MLGTGEDGGECCGKAIGEVNPSTLGKNNLVKINGCCCCCCCCCCHGAPSCIKILHLWMAICSSNLFFSKFMYFWPFMVVPGGRKNSPAVPFTDIPSQIMTLGGCFMLCVVYRSSNRFPVNCCTVDSSEKTPVATVELSILRVSWRSPNA